MTFDDFVALATNNTIQPYPYQRGLAEEGLPELLEVPTGAGKTMAAVLPWLYRRRHHPNESVRTSTPRWLVYSLPMRVLVEQTMETVAGWLELLYPNPEERPGLHLLMGGERLSQDDWRLQPDRDAIFVGTIDLLVSRAINRGYGQSRWSWPIDFGLFNNGCQWVFDEVQLMGPALPTSRQLHGLRRSLGTAQVCESMWMSATVDVEALSTVDAQSVSSHVTLAAADLATGLERRIQAAKAVHELELSGPDHATALATAALAAHLPGTRTLVFCNTVDRATDVFRAFQKLTDVPTVLVHSRFRPTDRKEAIGRAIGPPDPATGTIVVSTQVLEAGVDISSTTLVTESAPWPSIVQRAGRCNRYGQDSSAQILWTEPPKSLPYAELDLKATTEALRRLEGQQVTAASLPIEPVETQRPVHAVLRRRDLLDLFDTTPDLTGNDIDVSRFIRDSEGIDVDVVWRDEQPSERLDRPRREERCKVPIGQMDVLDKRTSWRLDAISGDWISCRRADIRPGDTVILLASEGGYDPSIGWNPKSKTRVEPLHDTDTVAAEPLSETDAAVGDDPLTTQSRVWMSLTQHLADVERAATHLVTAMGHTTLAPELHRAAITAARLHDIGKAHEVFQDMLSGCATNASEVSTRDLTAGPWAKSGGTGRGRSARRYFRHELASALALLGGGASALEGEPEKDLTVYLVAAHHGRVRVGFRAMPGERPIAGHEGQPIALGVMHGDVLPPVSLPVGEIPSCVLDLSVMALGSSATGERSWTARALGLRDRADLGPFRLAYLEALVRLADWQASSDTYRAEEEE